tara:strand:- start:338 stop:1108 length:771 start_codon:yes stop_codon:yes gene_type:complete
MATLLEVLAQRYPDTLQMQLNRGLVPGLQGSAGAGMRNIMNVNTFGAPTSPFVGPQQITGKGFTLVGGTPQYTVPPNRALVPVPQADPRFVGPRQMSLLSDRPMSQTAMNFLRKIGPYARSATPYGLLGAVALSAMGSDEPVSDETLQGYIAEAEQNTSWARRALDPTTPMTEDNETVRTAHAKHSKGDYFIVYPTIRQINGKLTKLSDKVAKSKAEELGDFVTFNNENDALRFSQMFSTEVGRRRNMFDNRGILN